MSRNAHVASVAAKYDAPADAEPVPDAASAPPAGVSETGSASVDVDASPAVEVPAGTEAPNQTLDHDVLRAKLEHDRQVLRAKRERKAAKQESEAARKAREEAEALKSKWNSIGKDKPWLDAIKEAGHDPREAYEQMRAEALKSGTPEAREEAMTKAWDAKLASTLEEHVAPLKKTLEEITAERDQLRKQNAEQGFVGEFREQLAAEKFKPLLEEYEPEVLFRLAVGMRDDPARLRNAAKALNVPLTGGGEYFTMGDIFNVMHATQADHRARMQRRNQTAAPQASQSDPKQSLQMKPPVNGTVERPNAATTLGNDLAASRATEAEQLKGMSRQQRVAYLAKKYG
jgi:hypothetical protein